MNPMKKILIVEDDPAILRGLEIALGDEHYEILTATDGERGELMAGRENIHLIILDLMLPRKNGLDVCRDLRARGVNTPILMLTSKKEELDKVMGLETGADDYMTKPFSIRELLARIKALLRRSGEISADLEEYTFGSVHVDFKTMAATRAGEPVKMSMREFEVLKYFIRHEGGVVTRDMLLNEVWGYESFPTTRTVDNYILSLRKKLEEDHAAPRHILTVHTAGYRFVK
jgi:DNA-binding response OmpR family regulator